MHLPKIPSCGAGLLFLYADPDGKGHEILLFQRRHRPQVDQWSYPGGHKEPGETFWECALRETAEEVTGHVPVLAFLRDALPADFRIESAPEHSVFWWPWLLDWRAYRVDLAKKPEAARFRLSREFSEARWFPTTTLPSETHWGIRRSLHYFGL